MVPSLPLLSCKSSVSVKENPDRKKKKKKELKSADLQNARWYQNVHFPIGQLIYGISSIHLRLTSNQSGKLHREFREFRNIRVKGMLRTGWEWNPCYFSERPVIYCLTVCHSTSSVELPMDLKRVQYTNHACISLSCRCRSIVNFAELVEILIKYL